MHACSGGRDNEAADGKDKCRRLITNRLSVRAAGEWVSVLGPYDSGKTISGHNSRNRPSSQHNRHIVTAMRDKKIAPGIAVPHGH